MKAIIFLLVVLLSLQLSGCLFKSSYSYPLVEASMNAMNYRQAAERLRRCSKPGKDSYCAEVMKEVETSGLSVGTYLTKMHKEKLKREEELERLNELGQLRESGSPWDKIELVLRIQDGALEEQYPGELNELLKESFFGFGECARNANPICMTQYASMILDGTETLGESKKNEAKKKALYWLNIASRYGNDGARKKLLSLNQQIPSPDLAMESLQKKSNNIAQIDTENQKHAMKQSDYYQKQMLTQQRKANFLNAMNTFFPKTVNCTSNQIGSYTYTNCR